MKKFFRGVFFAVLLSGAVYGVYHIVSWKDTTGGYLSSVQQLYHTEDNLIDVLFLGSSHCYCSVYPEYLWRDDGIAAFDLAISGQDKWASYYGLKEALKTQSPKVVAVECYGLLFDGYGDTGNKYRNLLSFKLSANSISLIRQSAEAGNRLDYILRWPIVHTRYRELQKHDFVQYEPSAYGRGANFGWNVGEGPSLSWIPFYDELTDLSEDNRQWMDDMIALSKENDFDLVFFAAPKSIGEKEQKIFNVAAKYASDRGCGFLDFGKLSEVINLESDSDFIDGNHCNADGAAKVTGYWGSYLMENFQLQNHRGDDAYELWDLSYRYYCRLETERSYNSGMYNTEEYLAEAFQDEDLTVIITLKGEWEEYSEELQRCLKSMDILAEDYPDGGNWVWKDNELLFSMNREEDSIYLLDLSGSDTLKLENRSVKYGEGGTSDVMIGRNSYGRSNPGMTVILYDNFRGVVTSFRELR